MNSPPLVLIPQYFGSVIFDHRTSRYLPFDAESTTFLEQLIESPLGKLLVPLSEEERQARLAFYEAFASQGFWTLDGRLAAKRLPVEVPKNHLVGPLALHLEIVGACNLKCTHCFAGELPRHQNPLSLQDMEPLFDDLAAMGTFRLGLTGGEPLLRKDIFDILDAATSRGLHPCITTNGLLITKEIAQELGRRKLVWLNVSLEGPDSLSNDPVRGAGTFEAVQEKIRLLAEHARFTLAFTIMQTNAHLVQQCAQLAVELGAHTAVFRPLYPVGTALNHLELMPSFQQYTKALQDLSFVSNCGQEIHSLDLFGPTQRQNTAAQIHTNPQCGAGQQVCSISVQGDVNPCSFLGPRFQSGNIREQSFREIWRNGHAFQEMRRPPEPGGFEGGCRARAQTFAGSVHAADPWYQQFLNKSAGHPWEPTANLEVDLPAPKISLPLVSLTH